MSKIRVLFNNLTGISSRHNKALRDVQDWLTIVNKFLTSYDLYGNVDYDILSEKVGQAKFDLTGILYEARLLVKTSGQINGKNISPLLLELTEKIEEFRRALINPSLHQTDIVRIVPEILAAFERLQDEVSDADYL